MATAAVIEKTDAELIAEEVAKIKAVNDKAEAKRIEDAAKGKPPAPTKVDESAQAVATSAAKEALDRVMGLQRTRIENIILARSRNIVADVQTILNMYSNSDYVKISYGADGKVTIVI